MMVREGKAIGNNTDFRNEYRIAKKLAGGLSMVPTKMLTVASGLRKDCGSSYLISLLPDFIVVQKINQQPLGGTIIFESGTVNDIYFSVIHIIYAYVFLVKLNSETIAFLSRM